MAKAAIIGFGTIGSGVFEVLEQNKELIKKRVGEEITVKRVVDIADLSATKAAKLWTKDFADVVADDEISVVIETMGGVKTAFDFTMRAFEAGKSVVTSNKEVVAVKGAELMAKARECGVKYLFEASVGGGIPVIAPLRHCLCANEITEICGILNGTTNYILTQMFEKGKSFGDALSEAQAKGYAEQNPDADVNGPDAARKISILTSLACGRHMTPDNAVSLMEGIRGISEKDVAHAYKWGGVIKLLGRSVKTGSGRTAVYVAPHFIKSSHPLAVISDVYNGIYIRGNMVGDTMFYGRGAGSLPTASAVVSDIMEIVRNGSCDSAWDGEAERSSIADAHELPMMFYLRFAKTAPEKYASLCGKLVSIFGQPTVLSSECDENIAVVTGKLTETELEARLSGTGLTVESKIRVLD